MKSKIYFIKNGDTYSALFEETDFELVQGLEKLQQEVI